MMLEIKGLRVFILTGSLSNRSKSKLFTKSFKGKTRKKDDYVLVGSFKLRITISVPKFESRNNLVNVSTVWTQRGRQ